MKWILASEFKPKVNQRVLIVYDNGEKITMGSYHPYRTIEVDYDNEGRKHEDYDEETDRFYYKEGWVSQCAESEFFYPINNVVYWAPLPLRP